VDDVSAASTKSTEATIQRREKEDGPKMLSSHGLGNTGSTSSQVGTKMNRKDSLQAKKQKPRNS